jgi:hypothetical protein
MTTETSFSLMSNLSACYRRALDIADADTRTAAAKKLVSVVKEGDQGLVEMYERVLFRGPDFEYLDDGEREIVKVHLLQQMKESPDDALMRSCIGLTAFLTAKEVGQLFHAVLSAVATNRPIGTTDAGVSLAEIEFKVMSEEHQNALKTLVERFIDFYEQRNGKAAIARLRPLGASLLGRVDEEDIPF